MEPLPHAGVLRFGERELDIATGELHPVPRGGSAIELGARPARLLALLAWHHGRLVSRDDIQRELWPDGTVVEFDACINQYIRQLRQLLGDTAATPMWIQTLPARGYRFLVPAERVDVVPAVEPTIVAPTVVESAPPPRSRRRLIGTAIAAVVLAGVMLAATDSGSGTPPRDAAVRIAVLPLTAEAPEQSRALGIADELITAIGESYAPAVEAISLRTTMTYRDRSVDIPAIARELGVDYILEGSVKTGDDRVRVSFRLVRGRDSAQIWARTFEEPARGWTLEATIASDVAAAVGRTIVPMRKHPDVELDASARDTYLRGRYLLRRSQPRRAAVAFEEVTRAAPRSAKAWAGLALAQLRTGADGFAPATASSRTALELDPAQPEAHYVRALVAFYAEWNVDLARDHFIAAIAANPSYAEAQHDIAATYSAAGRHAEAIASMQHAFELDPLSPEVVSDVGWYYYFARRYHEAASWCERTLAIERDFYWAHRCIVLARLHDGDPVGANAAALADLRAHDAPAATIAMVETTGLSAYWRWELDREIAGNGDLGDRAVTRLVSGDRAGALADLETVVATRRGWLLPFLAVDPTFDELRGDPRFEAVRAAVKP